jgi:transcription-repair coupling factor (superfamily II helicase)
LASFPEKMVRRVRWRGGTALEAPPPGLLAVWLAAWAEAAAGERGAVVVHVARRERRLRALAEAIRGLAPEVEVLLFPPWDCLPYDRAPPSRAAMGERMATLRRLAREPGAKGRVVLATAEALVQRVPPREAVADAGFRVAAGEELDLEALRGLLCRLGYAVDERVGEPGEAALRGGVVDLFPADAADPCRLELGDAGRVTAVRRYDALSQRSLEELPEFWVGAASEVVLPSGDSGGEAAPPDAHALPSCYATLATLLDHVPEARLVLDPEALECAADFEEQAREAHEARRGLRRSEAAAGTAGGALPEPERLYMGEAERQQLLSSRPRVRLVPAAGPDGRALPDFRAERDPRAAAAAFLRERLQAGERVVLAAADERDRRRLRGLAGRGVEAEAAALGRWSEIGDLAAGSLATLPTALPTGFRVPGLAVVTATDVLGPRPDRGGAAPDALLAVGELRVGDHVVHAEHGIGVLRGLELVEAEGVAGEHLALEYAGERHLLAPVAELDRVWRYGTAEADVALDRLDGEAWRARRDGVVAQVAEAATALARLVAERARLEAPALAPPREAYARFARRFAHEPSDDQAAAIGATLADLARGSPPMDRLVCGDVGFGKTEVALRAAAAAALDGRQVAVLAPTTLLVRQHLETFRRRFAGLGVRVEQLSRLGGARGAREVREGLADGSVRVVVGTHALASPQVRFKDLALVVIDEEQRFGARHKEALRRLRRGVHVLTMTATPIPRTLQSALAGLQELSVIATPPVRRQPVRTFVLPFDGAVVHEALLRERRRGGRSFVVVPRIADLEPMAERLAAVAGDLDVVAAHGRMKAQALDDAVLAFAAGEHDVLLTTSIVETGLDIPGADTMIVWRPERFGVAQLHQLRGRVGRGRARAAAYLLHEPGHGLTGAAEQRLRTLAAFEDLGAGFAISARDLDLRGAGDLTGEEQAGHVRRIGAGLYEHLLAQALRRARGEDVPEDWSPKLRLGAGELVPDDYVPEPELRLDLYARLARLEGAGQVEDLADEIADRFGEPPEAVRRTLAVAALRQRCRAQGVSRLEVGPKAAAATFRDVAAAERRWAALDEASGAGPRWKAGRLLLARASASPDQRLAGAAALLDAIEAGPAG